MAGRWRRNPELEREWRLRIAEWKTSGQNVREFCKAAGVTECRFFAWRRELLKRDGITASSPTKKAVTNPRAKSPFATVRIAKAKTPEVAPSTIDILFGEVTVRVAGGVDVTMLSHVLELLRRVS